MTCSLSGLVSAQVYSPFSLSPDLFPLPFWLHMDLSYSHGCTRVFLPDSMKIFPHVDVFFVVLMGKGEFYVLLLHHIVKSLKKLFFKFLTPKIFPLEAVLCYWECMIYLTQNIQWVRPISNPKRQCCESAALNMPANLENSAVDTGLGKVIFIPIPKKGNAKECSNYCTIALISHTSKAIFKFLQARLQQYVNHEIPDVQAGFRKGKGTRDQIANIHWIIEKAREFQKNILELLTTSSIDCSIDYTKAFDCVDHNKLWKSLQEMGIPDHLTCLLRNLCTGQESTVRTGHGTNRLAPNRKRSPSRLYIVTLLI